MSDYNPTDDELRSIAASADSTGLTGPLARLVLREREALRMARGRRDHFHNEAIDWRARAEQAETERDEVREYNRLLVEGNRSCLEEAHDELDQARAALARVEAMCARAEDLKARGSTGWLDGVTLRAAIAGDGLPAAPEPADPLTEAKIAHALAAARANTAFMNRLAERIEADRDLLDRLAGDGPPAGSTHEFECAPWDSPRCFRRIPRADLGNNTGRCNLLADDPVHQP